MKPKAQVIRDGKSYALLSTFKTKRVAQADATLARRKGRLARVEEINDYPYKYVVYVH